MKTRRYAVGTEVPVSKSRDELEKLLERHGAAQIQVSRDSATKHAVVIFRLSERCIRLDVKVDASGVPNVGDNAWDRPEGDVIEFPRGWGAMSTVKRNEWRSQLLEQKDREAWRRLLLITKGKLEIVADAESSIEREFLADILLPNGSTVHEALRDGLQQSYQDGSMPPLLPGKTA